LPHLIPHSLRWAKTETQIRYSPDSWHHMLQNATNLPKPLPATSNDFADAVIATAEARATSRDRHSPNGDRGAAANVGAGFSPSPATRRGDSTSPSENVAACPDPTVEADGRARLQPCQKQDQRHS